MTEFFYFLGEASEKFFELMPYIGPALNYFIIFSLTVGTIYWIYYMMKDPPKDKNYLSW